MRFTIPVILALFLQSLYGAVDLWVVGRYASSADVSAVSTGTQIMQTLTQIIAGLAMGTTILLGQQIGQGRGREGGRTIGASIAFFGTVAVLLSGVMLLNITRVAQIMNAPPEAFQGTCGYLRICSAGLILITAYNLLGGLFRGLGNSRVPLIAVIIAAICNIAGDLLLVKGFGMGAEGAALATVASQGVSVVLSLLMIRRLELPFSFRIQEIRWDPGIIKRIVALGAPIALMDFLVGISFLVILAIVNSLGLIASAGVGLAEKICAFVMLIPSAFGQSMAAFVAQNYGARRLDRAGKALRYGVTVSLAVGFAIGWLAFFHGDLLCSIFSRDQEVIAAGWEYLKAYAIDCLLTAQFFCMTGYFNGCGKTRFVMAQGMIGAFGVRVPVSYLMARIRPVSLFRVGLATPASSLVQTLLCIGYLIYQHRLRQKEE
ncbi:MAG: MATE family efflux transporter [Firmicutes bacterium]|nr:MATE family efflux transporter [Bacillota bacterium]